MQAQTHQGAGEHDDHGRQGAGLLDAPGSRPQQDTHHFEDALALLADLRRVAQRIDDCMLPDAAPACWTAAELERVSRSASLLLSRLLAAASPQIKAAYAAHLDRVG
jgi:hypothetical protein